MHQGCPAAIPALLTRLLAQTALAVLFQPAVKPKRKGGRSPAFGDLVLVPKSPAAARANAGAHAGCPPAPPGFKLAHGKKQAVKSGYRGVRQRPWGASRRSAAQPRPGRARRAGREGFCVGVSLGPTVFCPRPPAPR